MDPKDQIISLLKEADLYQQQGLLNEAKERYKKATDIIKGNAGIKNGQQLIASIVKRVVDLNQEIQKINEATTRPRVSESKQELIKTLFAGTGAGGGAESDLEGGIALAKFGQFERALKEFERLLDVDEVRVAAAKNIVRCHLENGAPEAAAECFGRWVGEDRFANNHLDKIRFFLESRLRKARYTRELPQREETVSDEDMRPLEMEAPPIGPHSPSDGSGRDGGTGDSLKNMDLPEEEEFLDINSVGIHVPSESPKGRIKEFDVSFQTGNSINLIISSKEKTLLEILEKGTKLNDMQFFSPIAILNGSGVVTAKTQIKSGPKEGDYSLDITILTT